ncbi:MAG: hypothetical protein HYV62_01305 [Candidatus Rokubacteria bacterium]|nr:hypothetical protein [Candidatus Rokubacteria bacterium]
MRDEEAIRELMAKLMRAVEASIATSAAVREALAELVRNGYEARLFFVANAESAESDEEEASAEAEDAETAEAVAEADGAPVEREIGAVPEGGDLRFELTKLDRDFLKSLHIRSDPYAARG